MSMIMVRLLSIFSQWQYWIIDGFLHEIQFSTVYLKFILNLKSHANELNLFYDLMVGLYQTQSYILDFFKSQIRLFRMYSLIFKISKDCKWLILNICCHGIVSSRHDYNIMFFFLHEPKIMSCQWIKPSCLVTALSISMEWQIGVVNIIFIVFSDSW